MSGKSAEQPSAMDSLMKTYYVLGLDIGTTCAKALAIDTNGKSIGQGASSYPLISNGNRIEQRAEDWIISAVDAVKQAITGLKGTCCGISLSTQGATTAALDADGKFIGNALTWMDGRATQEAAEIVDLLGDDYIYKTSGWRINAALDAAKIRWMRKQREYDSAVCFVSTLEVMNRYLTGNSVIDPTNAAIRQLYNVERNCWDEKLLSAACITENELPPVSATGTQVGLLCHNAASAMGLMEGIPVFNGAHDQYCAAIGAGATHSGDMLLSAGTTWALMGISQKPLFTKSYIAPGKHPEAGLYGQIASLICSGASLEWFKNNFVEESFDTINREVALREERTRDLMFFPYMAGAAYPLWQLDAKGAFTGISLEHDKFDFARAVMEGVAFGVRRAVDDFNANGVPVSKITIMGGAAKSPLWCQMISDVSGVSIERLNQADVCAVGAAVIALRGAKVFDSYADASSACVQPQTVYTPNPEKQNYYRDKFSRFDAMWNCLAQYWRT